MSLVRAVVGSSTAADVQRLGERSLRIVVLRSGAVVRFKERLENHLIAGFVTAIAHRTRLGSRFRVLQLVKSE